MGTFYSTGLPPCRVEFRCAEKARRYAALIRPARLWVSRAESAHEIDDQAYQQNQAKPAAADDRTAKVKPAAAEQEKQNHQEQ